MKITKTTEHTITFSVQYFYPNEGGMDNEQYGKEVATIEEALELYSLACIAQPNEGWVIVGEVEKKITKK